MPLLCAGFPERSFRAAAFALLILLSHGYLAKALPSLGNALDKYS